MAKVIVLIKKREFVEYYVKRVIEVSDEELEQIQNRPLQAKYWAERVVPYSFDEDAWSPLDDGRKSVSFEAIEVEVQKPALDAALQETSDEHD